MKSERVKRVGFADESILNAFLSLKSGRFEDRRLAGWIADAIAVLKENPFAGVAVKRRLWPSRYVTRFGIDNLRKL